MTRVVVIGIGNPWRGDDGVGHAVARELRGRLPKEVTVLEREGEASALIDAWRGAPAAILIDAEAGNDVVGTLRRRDLRHTACPPPARDPSGHAFGVAYAVALAGAIGALPRCLILYTVAGGSYGVGRPLSAAVEAAIPSVVDAIRREISALIPAPAGISSS